MFISLHKGNHKEHGRCFEYDPQIFWYSLMDKNQGEIE